MKRILILVVISLILCCTSSAGQGGGGESTKKKANPPKVAVTLPPVELNPFTGSLIDLAPQRVGGWKLVRTAFLGETTRRETGCTEAMVAFYEAPIGDTIMISIMKFSSVDSAREGIARTFRAGMAAGGNMVERVGDEAKIKRGREVGVRYALALRGKPNEVANIRWTNGTVGFVMAEVKSISNANNNLAFEKGFPW